MAEVSAGTRRLGPGVPVIGRPGLDAAPGGGFARSARSPIFVASGMGETTLGDRLPPARLNVAGLFDDIAVCRVGVRRARREWHARVAALGDTSVLLVGKPRSRVGYLVSVSPAWGSALAPFRREFDVRPPDIGVVEAFGGAEAILARGGRMVALVGRAPGSAGTPTRAPGQPRP